jgi:hypothetical protein
MPSRRTVLATLTTAVIGLGGCLGIRQNDPVRLKAIRVENYSNQRRSVSIQVLNDGEIVYRNEVKIRGREGDGVIPVWTEKRPGVPTGQPVLRAKLDDGEWEELDLAEIESACVIVAVEIDRTGDLVLEFTTDCDN